MLEVLSFRPLRAADRGLLVTATLGNLNWCGERFSISEVSTRPEFSHYTVVVPQRGDFGWVAELAGEAVGVAWVQYLPPDDPGYGFLAADVPELSVWVRNGWRGRGLGRALLRRIQQGARVRGVPRLSLSVEADNYTKSLYRAEGFVDVPGREADGVMSWSA